MGMLLDLLQAARRPRSSWLAAFRHLGAFGLFLLAILDSSPIPGFGGPDILTVILVATRRNAWYESAAAATAGSLIGAYITFRLAARAGKAYVDSTSRRQTPKFLKYFERWNTAALVVATAIPFPLPTSVFFAAAGASNRYSPRKYLAVVGISRAVRYSAVAFTAHIYGRHIIRMLRHPGEYWKWLLLFGVILAAVSALWMLAKRRFESEPAAGAQKLVSRGR